MQIDERSEKVDGRLWRRDDLWDKEDDEGRIKCLGINYYFIFAWLIIVH